MFCVDKRLNFGISGDSLTPGRGSLQNNNLCFPLAGHDVVSVKPPAETRGSAAFRQTASVTNPHFHMLRALRSAFVSPCLAWMLSRICIVGARPSEGEPLVSCCCLTR